MDFHASNFARAVALAGLWGTALSGLADAPSISNREPVPGEIGYRPADGAAVRLNPPSFAWMHEPAAAVYEVQWDRDGAFARPASASGFVWNTYTHREPFAPGTWHWRYRFVDAAGRTSTWSAARTVTVPPDAVPFPMPTRAQQRERVPAAHPRLFLRPEDLPRLRELAQGAERTRFDALRREADAIIRRGPTPEPEHMGSATDKKNKELVRYWWPNREQTVRACEEAETLAFVYRITGEARYGEAARRWVRHLAAWDPDGPTNFRMNCEAAKPLLYRLPRAYDWAWDALDDADRRAVQAVMARRVADAWKSGEVGGGTGHLTRPYNSHGNRVWHKIGEAGIALLGEVPEAEMWLDYAVNKFFACYPIWSDDDGGWHEGVSYWAGYMGKAVWWLQVSKSALGIDGLRKPFFANVGDYAMYIAPPHSPSSGFGDLSYRPPSPSWGGCLEYFERAKGAQPDGRRASYWRWWSEQWDMRSQDGVLGFLYAANLPPMPPARPPTDLPPSKVFHGIGVASLHTTLLDSRDDVHVLFKSSPFGTQSHGHNPHNTFQLDAYGEPLITSCTYRDLHGSDFHYRWVHSTAAQNGVLVDGKGQTPHTAAPHGRIVLESMAPEADQVAGDATEAYQGRLARYVRHMVLVKTGTPFVVICDDLEAKEPATFQFMLHALSPFTVDEKAARLAVQQPKAGAAIAYLPPAPLAFRQWDGFDPPPDKEFPNQWHVEASTRERAQAVRMVTVIIPHRGKQAAEWTAERIEAGGAVGAAVRLGGRRVTVTFPAGGGRAEVRVASGG